MKGSTQGFLGASFDKSHTLNKSLKLYLEY